MSQSLVQTGSEIVVSGGTSGSVTLNGVGAGNLLTASCANRSDNTHTFTASDNQANTWQSAVGRGASIAPYGYAQILYAPNVAGGNTTITITASGSIAFNALVHEWSGSAASPLAATDSYEETTAVMQQQASLSGINPAAPCVCIVAAVSRFGANPQVAGSGYTLTALDNWSIDEYQIFGSAPTNEHGYWSASSPDPGTSVIAAFKAASGVSLMPLLDAMFVPGARSFSRVAPPLESLVYSPAAVSLPQAPIDGMPSPQAQPRRPLSFSTTRAPPEQITPIIAPDPLFNLLPQHYRTIQINTLETPYVPPPAGGAKGVVIGSPIINSQRIIKSAKRNDT